MTHKIREELTVGMIFLDGGSSCHLGQNEKDRIIGGLDGTDDTDSLNCGDDGGFDDGYGGADGFESKQRRENCKRR